MQSVEYVKALELVKFFLPLPTSYFDCKSTPITFTRNETSVGKHTVLFNVWFIRWVSTSLILSPKLYFWRVLKIQKELL